MSRGPLPLAYGTSFGKAVPHWAMREVTWVQFLHLLSKPAESKAGAMSYILGTIIPGPGVKCQCKEYLHRTKKTVVERAAITLDADYLAEAGDPHGFKLLDQVSMLHVTYAAHTTWSSVPGHVRLRIIIPLSRVVTSLEYGPIARQAMKMLNAKKFDHTCDQPSRLMYLPSAPSPDQYRLWTWAGPRLDADLWLDLGGGPDTVLVREEVEVHVGELTELQRRQLTGLARKVAACEEGNRDSLLLWSLKAVKDSGMDPEIAGPVLVKAAVHAGLDEDVCWEKVARILG